MLFSHWRNEKDELISINHKKVFETNPEIVENRRKFIYYFSQETVIDDLKDEISKNNELEENETNPCNKKELDFEEVDIMENIKPSNIKTNIEKFPDMEALSTEAYNDLISSLNEKQKKYVLNTMFKIKSSIKPFYEFINGSAGTGKSLLIKAIHQSVNRYFDSLPGNKRDDVINFHMNNF